MSGAKCFLDALGDLNLLPQKNPVCGVELPCFSIEVWDV